jgi:DNA-directed RNA polymerase alpha subunit
MTIVNLPTAIPDHFLERLSTRARNVLAREGILSIEELLKFDTEDLYRLKASGRRTVHELERLQDDILEEYPGLPHCLRRRRVETEEKKPPALDCQASASSGSAALSVATDPCAPLPDPLFERLSTRARNVLVREKILSCGGLLAFDAEDLIRLKASGTGTVTELLRLQDDILEQYPELSHLLKRRRVETEENMQEMLDCGASTTSKSADLSDPSAPIPHHLLRRISTRAHNILIRAQILSCEGLLNLDTEDLRGIKGNGCRTVRELEGLQDKIVEKCPQLSRCLKRGWGGPEKDVQDMLDCGASSLPGPADWSILNGTLSELFQLSPPSCHRSPLSTDPAQICISG